MFQSQSGDTDEGATGGDDTLGDSSEKEHEIEVDDVSLHLLLICIFKYEVKKKIYIYFLIEYMGKWGCYWVC